MLFVTFYIAKPEKMLLLENRQIPESLYTTGYYTVFEISQVTLKGKRIVNKYIFYLKSNISLILYVI